MTPTSWTHVLIIYDYSLVPKILFNNGVITNYKIALSETEMELLEINNNSLYVTWFNTVLTSPSHALPQSYKLQFSSYFYAFLSSWNTIHCLFSQSQPWPFFTLSVHLSKIAILVIYSTLHIINILNVIGILCHHT